MCEIYSLFFTDLAKKKKKKTLVLWKRSKVLEGAGESGFEFERWRL